MSARGSASPDRPTPPRRKRAGLDEATSPRGSESRAQSDPGRSIEAGGADVTGAPTPRDGDLGDSVPRSDSDALVSTDSDVLREIELIQSELAGQRSGPTLGRPAAGAPSSTEPRGRERDSGADPRWGKPSPYLDERLNVARTVAARLAQEADRVERSLSGLKEDLETIDRELGHASDELEFVRSNERAGDALDDELPTETRVSSPIPSLPPSGSFPDFTVARYNATVSALHGRRRSLGWGTVVMAVGISALLLILTLRANEPIPATWLAVLPLVWMVPVPFFLAAFRGTQRVLKENRLELREDS